MNEKNQQLQNACQQDLKKDMRQGSNQWSSTSYNFLLGLLFACTKTLMQNKQFLDCTTPFEVYVYADAKADIALANTAYSRGNVYFCFVV